MQAPVEIVYEGAILAKGVSPSGSLEEGGTMFLPLTDPMPVGTRLELRSPAESTLVRVVKVTESADAAVAGIAVRPAGVAEPIEAFPEYEGAIPHAVMSGASGAYSSSHSGSHSGSRPTNGTSRPEASAPVIAVPQPVSPEVSAPVPIAVASTEISAAHDANGEGESSGESEETGSTSEYPALNGAPAGKKRQRRRKAK